MTDIQFLARTIKGCDSLESLNELAVRIKNDLERYEYFRPYREQLRTFYRLRKFQLEDVE